MPHRNRKTNKLRGSRTHGYGSAQKHRGAGSRGGRGMAGSKKHKWQRISKTRKGYLGKKGFKRHPKTVKQESIINVGYLSQHIESYSWEGFANKSENTYTIDLAAKGVDKLLGSGKVENRINVKVAKCSPKAKSKIEDAGGSVETEKEEFIEITENEESGGSDEA